MVESIEQGIAAPVLTLALQMRFASQDERGYSYRLLSLMRNAFGGHAVAMVPGVTSTGEGQQVPVGKVDPGVSSDKPKAPAAPAVPHEDVKTPDAPPGGIASGNKPAPTPAETQVTPPKDTK